MTIKLIVGLQNPGASYAQTRHNAGAWFAERLVSHFNGSFKIDKKLKGAIADIDIQSHPCRVLLPSVYMNQSGQSVGAVAQFYKYKPEEILVVHDELDLDVGRIKLKASGGHGGHNGLRDIAVHIGSSAFYRLRVGIGHPGHKDLVTPFVLGKPSSTEKSCILEAIDRVIDSISLITAGEWSHAMSQINK